MENQAIRIDAASSGTHENMSEAQRGCLSHILRNSAAAIEGLVMLLERRDCNPTPSELDGFLRGIVGTLVKTKEAFARGTFCALTPNECEFVGPFVGCRGRPVPGETCTACGHAKKADSIQR
jgi:hypothetical protein